MKQQDPEYAMNQAENPSNWILIPIAIIVFIMVKAERAYILIRRRK